MISVIVPCYKHANLLPQAVDSALAQTYPDIEIIVVDDGSPDDTRQVAARYGDQIRYIYQDNAGLSEARNTAIRAAKGEWIHLLDADDYLHPEALAHKMAMLQQHPNAGVLFNSWQEVDGEGRPGAAVQAKPLRGEPFYALFDPLAVGPPCRYTFKREAAMAAGMFEPSLKSCEDWDLWLRLANQGVQFACVPQALSYYRNYPNSMSKNHARMWRSGVSVLHRGASLRPGDARTTQALKTGIRAFRRHCYLFILRQDLHLMAQQGRFREAVSSALTAVKGDPLLVPFVLKGFITTLRRKAARA